MGQVDRSGRVQTDVAVGPDALADLLADVEAVGRLVQPHLDDRRSDITTPDPVWTLNELNMGIKRYWIVLAPKITREDDRRSVIRCRSTDDSDLPTDLRITTQVEPDGEGCTLDLTWSLQVETNLPRSMTRIAEPVVDRTVKDLLDDLTTRAKAQVEAQG